ncbi:MAG: hypothetical protein KF771_12305 [Burkholderiales bacterium]|nr:hypothetical protein [Burkholderiales bacterium]
MSFLANLSRVIASDEILPTVNKSNTNERATLLMLMVSADLHWRRKEWQAAIDMSARALKTRPKDFHALSILVTSYGHLRQFDAAYPYAKRLLLASPPTWKVIKAFFALVGIFQLFTAKGRESYRRAMLRCDQEAQADRDAQAWAQQLVSARRAANDPIVA